MERLSYIKQKPISSSICIAIGIGFILCMLLSVIGGDSYIRAWDISMGSMMLGAFFVYPCMLTLINIISLFIMPKSDVWKKIVKKFEYITIVLGLLYMMLCLEMGNVMFDIMMDADWSQQLYNREVHQPIWTEGLPVLIALWVISGIGYVTLSCIKLEKLPPLIIVLSIAAMYLGIFECIMWCIQIFSIKYLILCLYPFNCVIIAMKTIRYKIYEWNMIEEHHCGIYKDNPVLNYMNQKLMHAAYWPVIAFIFMWPLLGVILCILMLFGQKPDAFIKVWTETADWRLSERTAPPNLFEDEHYLCTVAAGGHKKIVKPIRMGERHGHRVVVNRQLCIANAFEQILEEKVPRLHKYIRRIYDTYGFPVAKLIRTKCAADVVYFIMKPLEWLFLIVIYLCDVKPENRIAVQYLPKDCK